MPTTIHVAYSTLVNPQGSSSTPFITRAQLWAGLDRKVRHAQDFVPVFTDCHVLSEETNSKGQNVVTRRAIIKEGELLHIAERHIEEVCTYYPPSKVDFLGGGGRQLAQNVISDGPSLTDSELVLTYIFDWTHADVAAGSAEETAKREEQRKGAKTAVESTLTSVRRMVQEGVL